MSPCWEGPFGWSFSPVRPNAPRREAMYRAAAEGEVDVLVGTQALIQEGVGFKSLGLAVIDEQHRFGVMPSARPSGRRGERPTCW